MIIGNVNEEFAQKIRQDVSLIREILKTPVIMIPRDRVNLSELLSKGLIENLVKVISIYLGVKED